jgi:hypothetical protein
MTEIQETKPSPAEIRKRVDATFRAPWTIGRELDGLLAGQHTTVKAGDRRIVTVGQTRPHHRTTAEANVEFIAHARQDVPALLDALDAVLAVPGHHTPATNREQGWNDALYVVRAALEAHLRLS